MKKNIFRIITVIAFTFIAFSNVIVFAGSNTKLNPERQNKTYKLTPGNYWYKVIYPGWTECQSGGMLCCPGFDC